MNTTKLSRAYLFLVAFVVCSFAMIGAANVAGAESKDKAAPKASEHNHGAMDEKAMMEKWKEFATPNENHKVLDALVGSWDTKVSMWMAAGAKPEVTAGTSEIKWIMGGRFIEQKATGMAMGQPFEGQGIMGYDNQKKEYSSFWIDNMGTGVMKSSGQYDAKTKTISDAGTFSCPMENEKAFRGVTKIVSKNSFTYEMYMAGPDGKEFRMMEIVYTRKK